MSDLLERIKLSKYPSSVWLGKANGQEIIDLIEQQQARIAELEQREAELSATVERLKAQQSEVAARAVEEILSWNHSYIQTEEGRFAYHDDAIETYANQLREQDDE